MLSQKRNLLHTFAIVFGLFLAGIPLAFLLAGRFVSDGGNVSMLIFLLFLAAWIAIGTLCTRMSAKALYWSLHAALWLFALVLGSIASSAYQWFPGWLALLFPIGGSLFFATLYRPFMERFPGKTGPQPAHPYKQSYQQGYRSTSRNPAQYPDDQAYPYHEQPQANYPEGMAQQQ
jgi:hypothetical protein